eukprot:TRINITY_DN313_c0_g1_i1.p1 TRINITY_DN313_c0_g1~~TRINITY_DN313_c0_g1_i1.p1  ORF type:complete len:468 (-),score=142.19 TRINITY_DN313_c0_g1_i1:59-1411(-)
MEYAKGFLDFVNKSPSPFHAVHQCVNILEKHGFKKLKESEKWDLIPGGKYFFTRNQSTIFAFAVGKKYKTANGFNIIGAHTDSPCLKVKPISKTQSSGYLQLGVQCYGGGLWYTWFDRDLAIGGRVMTKNDQGIKHSLVFINKPICRVPTLAIHLDTTLTDGFKPNKENHVHPILATKIKAQLETKESDRHHPILLEILSKELDCKPEDIKDFELSLCDASPGVIGGLKDEFIFSARLDNLLSCYCAVEGLVGSLETLETEESVRMIALFDHEEVGSDSQYGAGSNMTQLTITRISKLLNKDLSEEDMQRTFHNSFLISSDNAHAVHPNYSHVHEVNHKPMMHNGPVIKVNSNQRYATSSVTSFLLKEIAEKEKIPVQEFVVKNDSPCGSTIGPILSSNTGLRTVDLGIPQLSMHSIREMCGVDDLQHTIRLFHSFFNQFSALNKLVNVD